MQRDSTKLRDVEPEQLTLVPQRSASRPVSLEHIPVLTSTAKAIEYACDLAGLDRKQIFPHMGKEKTAWSRICSGEFDLPGRDILKFSRVVGNDAYLLFLVHQHQYDLTTLQKAGDDKDREIFELRQQVADRDRAIELFVKAAKGRA
jgi:plasmid maintenance system antidote protein VapI